MAVCCLNIRDDPRLTREVIRSRYISTTEPDMTRVTVRLDTQPRVGATYTCTVYVEGRGGDFIAIGTGRNCSSEINIHYCHGDW